MAKITVVGAGNGGFAVASDLAINGHEVVLLAHPEHTSGIEHVREAGGITLHSLESSGRACGFAKLESATSLPEEALKDTEIVFVVVPAYAQSSIAKFCAPYLNKNHKICLMPGNMYGGIAFLRDLKLAGNNEVKAVAEAECLIYTATRKEGSVGIRGFKRGLGLSVFPSRYTSSIAAEIMKLYPEMVLRKNTLATGVSNPNIMLHVPLVMLNFANIERGLDVLAYHAAFTEGVGALVEKMDEERMQLKAIGAADVQPIGKIMKKWYASQGAQGDSLHTIMSTNPLYAASKLPKTKEHRYFTEDIPYGICPVSEVLDIMGLPNRLFRAAADIAGGAWGCDFFAKARTLSSMGLNFSSEQFLLYLENGE